MGINKQVINMGKCYATLGRSMNIDTSAFITLGVILVFLGIVICLGRIAYMKISINHSLDKNDVKKD